MTSQSGRQRTPSRLWRVRKFKLRLLGVKWRNRMAAAIGAVTLGLVALGFADVADRAQGAFSTLLAHWPWAPLALTPLGFAVIVAATRRWAPFARGSGIPQVIAAARRPDTLHAATLVSLRTAAIKIGLTTAVLFVGGSVGREGPTVQVSAAIMQAIYRRLRIPLTSAIVIAGGAAGVSAAFNTPLAGVAFAIEELASAYEQKLALLVMGAVMISGLVSLGVAGDYIYFGEMHERLTLGAGLLLCPAAGVIGGLCGGLFSRALLAFGQSNRGLAAQARARPILWAGICGASVAVIGFASGGTTWGSSYAVARSLVEGQTQSLWFGPEKIFVTLTTALSGVPGGIFAPSLAAGSGLGNLLAAIFHGQPAGAAALLGMIAYFVGVTRAPLTSVLIISEMTDSRGMILPLFVAALIADGVSALVCREKLYHGLSKSFREPVRSKVLKL